MAKANGTRVGFGARPKLTAAQLASLRQDRERGMRHVDLAAKYRVSLQTVSRALRRDEAGVDLAAFAKPGGAA
jgi:Mor family transcriptional regulator